MLRRVVGEAWAKSFTMSRIYSLHSFKIPHACLRTCVRNKIFVKVPLGLLCPETVLVLFHKHFPTQHEIYEIVTPRTVRLRWSPFPKFILLRKCRGWLIRGHRSSQFN